LSRKERNKIEVNLRRGRANRLFAMQLGPLWTGPQNLPPHVKALFAIFAARANGDPAAVTLFRQLNLTCTTKMDFSGIEPLLKKHMDSKLVKEVTSSHAYVLTVMASMLALARTDGVQATADFLWLKPLDRRLWYTLNTVGRQTPFTEVAGIFAHWVAEKEMGRKLLIPMVEEATNALDLALKEIIYKPDEE
jgi:intracellular multiplication protein IcmP